MSPPPLAGIRVADFSRVIAGPLCAMTLADLGADVVKIENPEGGDDTRGYTPPDYKGLSAALLCYNRNKRSIALDLNKADDLAIARRIIARSDVLIENFRTGLMARYALDYETLAADRPDLVYCSVSAYGRDGPFKARAGYDPVVQAESGFMSMTGHTDRPPVRTGVPMIDVTTGMTAAQAVIAALIARRRDGRGQFVEVPLFDTGFSMTLHASLAYLVDGNCPERSGNGSNIAQPIGVFEASDGPFYLTAAGERPWRRLAIEVLRRPDLADDPDFATNAGRVVNQDRLKAVLNEAFAADKRENWIRRMREAGVPVGPIRTIEEAFNSAETEARGLVRRLPQMRAGDVPDIRSPLRLARTPVRDGVGAPYLDQDRNEVLAELEQEPLPLLRGGRGGEAAPLAGLKVLDFTRVIAGPHCAMTLGDLGADVLKVEHPQGGDDSRGYQSARIGGEGAYFLAYNRNKRSIALDLARPEGRAAARALAAKADVVIENFSTGVMRKFGLDYEALGPESPSLVYCSISGYGRDGAFATRAGYDPVVQAESGFMWITGYPDREPVRTGIPMIDVTTGLAAAQAVLAALYHRDRTGEGQYVETALFDTAAAMTYHFGMAYLVDGKNPMRQGNGSPAAAPIGVFQAADGPFQMTVAGERIWRRLVLDVLDRPDLLANPNFERNPARVANRERLTVILDDIFGRERRDAWVDRMRAAGVPAGPIRTIAEACEAPEVRERGLILSAPHAAAGTVPCLRNPMRFSATRVRDPVGAPTLGQHTDEALRDWLGWDEARIAELRSAGVVV